MMLQSSIVTYAGSFLLSKHIDLPFRTISITRSNIRGCAIGVRDENEMHSSKLDIMSDDGT
jgi:hypothetical protein